MIRREDPDVLFLYKTKIIARKIEAIKMRLGFMGCLGVVYEGRRGRLALLWKESIEVTILNFSKSHIQALVSLSVSNRWTFTIIYGHLEAARREKTWALL